MTSTLASAVADRSQPRFEHIYVHVPFCRRRCSYCDFAIAVRKEIPTRAFNDAIMAEVATRRIELDASAIRSIYLGGGTPSQLGPTGVRELLDGFRRVLGVEDFPTTAGGLEVTIEANPEDVTSAAAAVWREVGVNRVSLGVQSFDPATLAWMHRGHGAEDVQRAVGDLRAAGVDNLSVDLIFAVPRELGRDWERDLTEALALEPDHLSVYGLTVEPHTPLGKWTARGTTLEASEDAWAEEFLQAHDRLTAAGFEHYEVSNYGRPARRSRHNSAYWSGAPYLGLGPSAHGYDGTTRRWNEREFAAWLARIRSGEDPIAGSENLTPEQRMAEEVYLGLRTSGGLAIHQNELETVTMWVREGWAELDAQRARLTATGWMRLDALATALTSLRSRS